MSVVGIEGIGSMSGTSERRSAIISKERRHQIISVLIHLLLLLILGLPWMNFPIPPPGQQGIIVNFGEPEAGGDQGGEQDLPEEAPADDAADPQKDVEGSSAPAPARAEARTPIESPQVIRDRSSEAVMDEQKEQERQEKEAIAEKQRVEAERKAKQQQEEETRRKAEEAAAKQRAYEKAKSQYGGLFGDAGKGDGQQKGEKGDPTGQPGEDRLTGLSTGAGRVGDGLGDRGVLYHPRIEDRSQETGVVVIYICVNGEGRVETARFTQKGSTTTDRHLVELATETARKYKFTSAAIKSQCGTITFDFKVK